MAMFAVETLDATPIKTLSLYKDQYHKNEYNECIEITINNDNVFF